MTGVDLQLGGGSARSTERSLHDLLRGLVGSIRQTTDKREFLAEADRMQSAIAMEAARVYGEDRFARLFAVRLVNLVVARYHFEHRHRALASRPFQLMLDPVNNCHLSCPGCLHSANPRFDGVYDWPGGRMSPELFAKFLEEHGATAWGVVFYNWGEPLLHKQVAALIREAKRYLLHACLSTNLSLPFDADGLVASGLNFLFLSIDGATQETYARFRRGGDLGLVLANVRRVIEARDRQGSSVPYVLWRYLTFEHNLHEVEMARDLARDLGVDQFSVTTPFAVDWDDPTVKVARSPLEGVYRFPTSGGIKGPRDEMNALTVDEAWLEKTFETPWGSRLPDPASLEEASRAGSSTCTWLYQSLTLDARARLMPCCMAPERDRHKIYGSFLESGGDSFNAPDFVASRQAFADREAFDRSRVGATGPAPYCAVCWEKPDLTYTLRGDVSRDLRLLDPAGVVPDDVVVPLTEWPASR